MNSNGAAAMRVLDPVENANQIVRCAYDTMGMSHMFIVMIDGQYGVKPMCVMLDKHCRIY